MTILEICNIHKPFLVRDLELYRPILFSKYCSGSCVEEFGLELQKLANDVTYYQRQCENSKFISDFYNKETMLKTWKEYYLRVFDKWNLKKQSKNIQ